MTVVRSDRMQGMAFVRRAIALASEPDNDALAASLARQRWPGSSVGDIIERTAVPAMNGAQLDRTPDAMEFLGWAFPGSIMGRLPLREVPAFTSVIGTSAPPGASFVARGKPRPVSAAALARTELRPATLSGLIVVSREILDSATPEAEAFIRSEVRAAVIALADQAFIDPDGLGDDPQSITHGVTPVPVTGDPATDLQNLIDDFSGDLSQARLIMSPATATKYALHRDTSGSFCFLDVGPAGGSLLGLPVITSSHVEDDMIALADPSRIVRYAGPLDVTSGSAVSIQMDDTPDDPDDANTVLVSLWQRGLRAIMVDLETNWHAGPGAVSVLRLVETS